MKSERSFQDFVSAMGRSQIANLYCVLCEEPFLLDEAMSRLEPQVLGSGLRDFNFNAFHGSDLDSSQVRDAAETLPMMASARLIHVKDAQELSEKDWEALLPIIKDPVPSSVVVFSATKLDKRRKSIKLLLENSENYLFKRPYGQQVAEWISRLAAKHEVQFDAESASLFQELVGESLTDINSELMKLSQFLGEQKVRRADVAMVLKVVSRRRMESIFDLTNAIGRGDQVMALSCLVHLLDFGESPVGIVAMVTRHVRILRSVLDGLKKGLTGPRLATHAGVAPYFVATYVEQARAWNSRKVDDATLALAVTDRALKSSPLSAHIWLENFVLQTCGRGVSA